MCDKFVTFDEQLKHMGSLGDKANFSGVIGRNERNKGVLRALHSVPASMGVPPGFISNYNLNFIKYLSVISIFATPAGGHTSISKNTLSAQTKVEIRGTQQKFLILIFINEHILSHIFTTV